ncbi:MAG: cysteine--tRNA ligase, partial [Acidobacteria bacterium]
MFKLTNTLTGEQEVFEPQDKETARMYTCGPTVYNFVHIGNLRTFVFQDILRRHLSSKWKLRHVMNITDIDDKIIARSIETGQDIKSYTAVYTAAFFEDCEKLRIRKPEIIAPATEHIDEMI